LKKGIAPAPVRPVFREALHDLIADVRRAGAEPIFVIAPTINAAENFTEIPDGAAVFALNDPAQYPELFNPEKHYDAWHLNEKGAVDFTAILAQKFVERRKAHESGQLSPRDGLPAGFRRGILRHLPRHSEALPSRT